MPRQDDEDEALWDVLGRGREHRASPFFVRNILREVRQTQDQVPGWTRWVRSWRVALPLTAAAVAVCAGIYLQPQTASENMAANAAPVPTALEKIEADPDYEIIAELDTLLAYESNNQWLDSTVSN